MKILYLGRHGQQNNDDEGAITWSFRQLGHEVYTMNYRTLAQDQPDLDSFEESEFDFVLFHKLPVDYARWVCNKWKGVVWFFDPLYKGFPWNDKYIEAIDEHVYRGFYTDGDYVRIKNRPNVIDLKQGFDSRMIGITTDHIHDKYTAHRGETTWRKLLFIGQTPGNGYRERAEIIMRLSSDFGPMAHLRYTIFQHELKYTIENTQIMLALPPVSDSYWSNRVYILGGYGAYILHPYSADLAKQFSPTELTMFHNYDHLVSLIRDSLASPEHCKGKAQRTQAVVLDRHCYIHRVEKMLEQI